MNKPQIVVLILSYNGKELLQEAVSSYLGNSYSNFITVVIDNGSIDGTEQYIREKFPVVHLLRLDRNKGYSGGFNYGLNYAFNKLCSDYALLTNNDVKADKEVIESLVQVAMKDKKIGFVTGKVYYYDKPNVLQTVGKSSHPILWKGNHIGNRMIDQGQFDVITERDWCDDIFWLVSRELYLSIGGYDTTFFLQAEDYDWQARAKKEGFKIYYTPLAKIWHKESATIGKTSSLKAYYDARNPMLVILKHKDADFFRIYFWQHFRKAILKNSIKLIIKDIELKKVFKIWQGFLSAIIWGFKNKKFTHKHFLPL